MKAHFLKTWPKPFEAVANGLKKFEYRRNDRDFNTGDILVLQEWDPTTSQYSGYSVRVVVTYMIAGSEFGIPDGYCVMSIDFTTQEIH